MKSMIIVGCLVAAASAVSFYDLVQEEWTTFKLEYNKNYENEMEDKYRMKIYAENRDFISKHNRRFQKGQVTFRLKLNKYADLLHHEFVQIMNGFNNTYKNGMSERGSTFLPPANVVLPDQMDWRKEGAVSEVKDQGQCGSCWSFSATGAIEGQHFRKTGSLVSLSEQNLIDCAGKYDTFGCTGGGMPGAFDYVRDNKGIDTEESYPYQGVEDKCRYDPEKSGAEDTGHFLITSGAEDQLLSAVATVGPISMAVDSSLDSFQFYADGVYYDPNCSAEKIDHAMLVVGYGTDETGGDYWIVKNSWGTSWGEQGYIKMARNRNNHCGIATDASYPKV